MKIKGKFIILLSVLMLFCVQVPVMAETNLYSEKNITYLKNGDYIVTEIITHLTRSSTKSGAKKLTYVNSAGEDMWYVQVNGTFTYTGTQATCESVSVETYVYGGGWKVKDTDCYKSGNTAYGEATAKRYVLGIPIETATEELSLTCSATGKLS